MEVLNGGVYPQQVQSVPAGQQSVQSVAEVEKVDVNQELDIKTDAEKMNAEVTKIDSNEKMDELVEELNEALSPFNTSLKFGFDNKSEDFYVSLIESKTNKLIRRFPAEEAASLVPKMKEFTGMIFDQKG